MATFLYTSLDSKGKDISGEVIAADINSAADQLRMDGKIITSLKEVQGRHSAQEEGLAISPLESLTIIRGSDIAILFRQLSVLIESGVTLVYAIRILSRQAKKTKLKKILLNVIQAIEEGSSFSGALKKYPRYFSNFITSMVESGELGGTLDIVLERIAIWLEERSEFKTQVITSFIYPIIVIVMSIAVVSYLVGVVIPKFIPFIEGRGGHLPWNTQFLIDITHWLESHWMFLNGALGIAIAALYVLSKYEPSKYWLDRIKLKIPVFGPIFVHTIIVLFSRNLASLLGSGVSILESLRTVRDTLGNRAAMRVINIMEQRVSRGETLSAPVRESPSIFPPMVAEMIAVGEESGAMDKSLNLVAKIHEQLLKTHVKRVNSLIEPALIIILGCIVGFVVWGLIAGILSVYGIYR